MGETSAKDWSYGLSINEYWDSESCYTYYELKFTMYIKSIMVDTEWLCSLIQVPMEHLVLESKAQICFEMHKCTTFSYCYLW